MNYIVLDTNVLHNDWNLYGTRLSVLTATAARLNNKICIPMVVVDELNHQYIGELKSQAEQYNKSMKRLSNMKAPIVFSKYDPSPEIDVYKDWMLTRLKDLNVSVLPYPNVKHDIIVQKELDQKKPFLSSQKGYRDALIWESVKELRIKKRSVSGKVYFLSENTSDFASKDKKSFHEDLVDEMRSGGIAAGTIEYVPSIDKFIEENITNTLQILDSILTDLTSTGGHGDIDFNTVIHDHINESEYSSFLVENVQFDDIAYCPAVYEDPSIANIELEEIHYTDVRRLSESKILVKCTAKVHVDIDFFIQKSDVYLYDGTYPIIINDDWNDYYCLAEDYAVFEVEYSIIVNSDFTNVESENSRVINAQYGCGAVIEE